MSQKYAELNAEITKTRSEIAELDKEIYGDKHCKDLNKAIEKRLSLARKLNHLRATLEKQKKKDFAEKQRALFSD